MNALIAGGTGLIGQSLTKILTEDPRYVKICSLVRNKTGADTDNLQQLIIDFDELDKVQLPFQPDVVFCTLGTTIKTAGSKAAFRRVDHDYALDLASLGKTEGASAFHIVTAMGADSSSGLFYNQVKGDIEEAVSLLEYNSLCIYRPSLLIGPRNEKRFGERIAQGIVPLLNPLMIGPLRKYRAIAGSDVAKVMHKMSHNPPKGKRIFLNDEILDLAQ